MSDAGDPKGDDKRLNNLVAVTVVLLTVFMAITKTKDNNIYQAMQKAKADAVDAWAEYQFARVKLHVDENGLNQLRLLETGGQISKELAAKQSAEYEADLILLDAYSDKARGGTGERFDWGVAKSLRGRDNIVVSGGLGPENVREAVEFFEPYGVDASSSLEDEPGRKNGERVRRFVLAARD